jgi:Predicted membrane protein
MLKRNGDQGRSQTMEVLILAGRTAILWLTALVVFRFMGKRTLGKMGPFDFAVAIMIGEPVITLKGMEC